MVMIDTQTVRGGRAGPTFHSAGDRGGRTIGTKRTIMVDILGLPFAVRADPAKPHDVRVGREFLAEHLVELPRLAAVVGDRGYRGLAALAARRQITFDIKAPPKGTTKFVPLAPLYGSSMPFPNSDAGGGCRAATREPRPVPARG